MLIEAPRAAGSLGIGRLLEKFAALFASDDRATRTDRRTASLLVLILIAGVAVRFWGLGDVGLHGDEKTMALPTMHLVEHGSPRMPSGMYYARAVGQLYLMAASVEAFGKSEWALRLPSALCGVLLIVLAWTAGRRFLTPAWNLALAAAVAFLPSFIEDAQTARMYVFLTTSVAGFMTLVFAWERTNRTGYLFAAVAAMLVGLQFHTLAVFAAFIVFIPGLLRGEARTFWAGAAAFAAIVVGFLAIDAWTSSQYFVAEGPPLPSGPRAVHVPYLAKEWLALAALPALGVAALIVGWHRTGASGAGSRTAGTSRAGGAARGAGGAVSRAVPAVALLALALLAELALSYHLAALLMIAGLVIAWREGRVSAPRIALLLGVSLLIAASQAAYMHAHSSGVPRQILGVMLGWPSVWPLFAIAEFSPVAAVLAAAGLAAGLWRMAHHQRVPDHVLLLALAVWLPILMIGFFRWTIPPRYAEAQIMPLLIGAFATAQWAAKWLVERRKRAAGRGDGGADLAGSADLGASVRTELAVSGDAARALRPAVAVAVCALVVNPAQVAAAVHPGYDSHPDHKGAAKFIAALHPGPRDILVAEDVLQQNYYLGHVDYWLMNEQVAAQYMYDSHGKRLDFYTNTPLIGTGQQLQQLVDRADRGAIYVIGSGEDQEDGRRLMRGRGIAQTLQSPAFHVIYRGRDGFTRVWKVDPPQPAALRQ